MAGGCVTVFGGTGFLGRRIVAALLERGVAVRVAVRHPERVPPGDRLDRLAADLRDPRSIRAGLDGADAAVNAVSLYVESRGASFRAIHVEGARRLAAEAAAARLDRLVHISGIGSDPGSASAYVSARGEGEAAVRAAFPSAAVLRPSVMFGPDDAFLSTLTALVRRLPVIPLFGDGATRLQPVHCDDVAAAVAAVLAGPAPPAPVHELGGPEVHSYRALLALVMRRLGRRRPMLPVPFPVWDGLAAACRLLPSPPITEGQVALMRRDNAADPAMPGLAALGIAPTAVEAELDRRERAAA